MPYTLRLDNSFLDFATNIELTNEIFTQNLFIKSVRVSNDVVCVDCEKSEYNLRFVNELDYYNCFRELQKVSDEFLSKPSWNEPIYEMLYNGLASRRWYGFAFFTNKLNADKRNADKEIPIAYIDFQMTREYEIELGIAFCNPEFRNKGLTSSLLNLLKLMYPDMPIIGGTYEANKKMIGCYKKLLFSETERKNNRIDGTSTVYFRCEPMLKNPQNVNIRFMHDKDYPQLIKVWESAGKGIRLRSEEDNEEKLPALIKQNWDTSFVATVSGKIIGTVICGHDGKRGYIYHMYVSENYRKRNIGSLLFNQVKKNLLKKGIVKISYVIFKDNSLGKSFYNSFGAKLRDDVEYFDIDIV